MVSLFILTLQNWWLLGILSFPSQNMALPFHESLSPSQWLQWMFRKVFLHFFPFIGTCNIFS